MIGALIGPGGKIIQKLQEDTNTDIVIEPEDEVGVVYITAQDQEGLDKAVEFVKRFNQVPEVGKVYTGIVKEIHPNWAIVEFIPGITGLLHKSQIDYKYVSDVSDYLSVGDQVKVKLIEYNKDEGIIRLSRKALLEAPQDYQPHRPNPHNRQNNPQHRGGRRPNPHNRPQNNHNNTQR